MMLLMLMGLAISALSDLFASVFAHQEAERIERSWRRSGAITPTSFEWASHWLNLALKYSPINSDYGQQSARLVSWALSSGMSLSEADIDRGLQNSRDSLGLRPYWSYT